MTKYDFDLITIGAGSGGVRASRFAATKYGARAAVIENRRVGGTCVMRGCVPKKLLVYGTNFAEEFQNSAGYGWPQNGSLLNWSRLIEAKDSELQRLEGIYHELLKSSGVEEISGTGRIIDAHTVDVDDTKLTTKYILVATGGYPAVPEVPGIEHVINSDQALDLKELPKHIVIVGGGYIAVEFAGIFNAAGVETHLIFRADNLLRGFDEDVRKVLQDEIKKKGINLHASSQITSIQKADTKYRLDLQNREIIETDLVMYATGRRPNSIGIGLEEVGIEINDRGAVIVDETSKTAVDSIYAIGDLTDRINLTPVALEEGMAVIETIFGETPTAVDYTNVASAVFSQPPVASVGLTENEARDSHDVDIYCSSFKPMKHTLSGSNERTMMKLIVDKNTDKVLGCHMVGPDAPEIIQGFAVALKCGATKTQFDSTIGIHPTAAEEFVTMRTPS